MSAIIRDRGSNLRAHAPRHLRQQSFTARKWEIRAAQARLGLEPCFSTPIRHQCRDIHCPWRRECKGLRAEWRR